MGERLNGIQEVVGSIPISSTNRNHFRKNNLASSLHPLISVKNAKFLIARPVCVAMRWERLNLMPLPKEYLSDRLILYDRDEVRCNRTSEGRPTAARPDAGDVRAGVAADEGKRPKKLGGCPTFSRRKRLCASTG